MNQLKFPDYAGVYKLLTECSDLYAEVISASFSQDQKQEKLLSLLQKYQTLHSNFMQEWQAMMKNMLVPSYGLTMKSKVTK